jgi:hypothetical protein
LPLGVHDCGWFVDIAEKGIGESLGVLKSLISKFWSTPRYVIYPIVRIYRRGSNNMAYMDSGRQL